MTTFPSHASRAGRWVRHGRNVVILLDDDPSSRRAASDEEMAAWIQETESSAVDVAWVQRSLNQAMGSGLTVDGILGPRTSAAITAFQRREGLTADAVVNPATVAAMQRATVAAHPSAVPAGTYPATPPPDVGVFDNKPCAAWLIPYLQWARDRGWRGVLNSGWRDPVKSEGICMDMCGAPSCPGRCAGRLSNHSGSVKPKGAVDVSEYTHFAQLMASCPYSPRIFNDLPNDRVHFSATGH